MWGCVGRGIVARAMAMTSPGAALLPTEMVVCCNVRCLLLIKYGKQESSFISPKYVTLQNYLTLQGQGSCIDNR